MAITVIRDRGTQALTLVSLAEQAGVSKPVVYEHFGTRAGLLLALYNEYDVRQTEAIMQTLAVRTHTPEETARVVAGGYIDCAVLYGHEYSALAAALAGSTDTNQHKQSRRAAHMEQLAHAFRSSLPRFGEHERSVFSGLLGAAESLSEDAAAGRRSRDHAVRALSALITAALQAVATEPDLP
ncbi:TetR/AcrR family transcriptional regulator [Deinococcus hopiensis]|uniref:TetR/AcrR family transcriptional regulator n=1 Tax=Deinococcus hopiensis TaxID=309885 RepID=UPI001482EDDF|nr:TetR/AcrR family transcriptional regulator [Deinococcus hopiensis]